MSGLFINVACLVRLRKKCLDIMPVTEQRFGHFEDIPVTGPIQYVFRMSKTFVQADNRQDRLAQQLAGGEQAADRQDIQTGDKTDGRTKQNGQRRQDRVKA